MKKNLVKIFFVGAFLNFIASSCATDDITPAGAAILIVRKEPKDKKCSNLGPVFGKGGGSFGGSWLADEDLMKYSYNRLRNNAAKMGATHIVLNSGHQMGMTSGRYGGSTSTSTVSGVAFKCE